MQMNMFKVCDDTDLNTNKKCTDITVACDHIDFKTYTVIQVTHNHDNHCGKKLKVTSMVHDHIDSR